HEPVPYVDDHQRRKRAVAVGHGQIADSRRVARPVAVAHSLWPASLPEERALQLLGAGGCEGDAGTRADVAEDVGRGGAREGDEGDQQEGTAHRSSPGDAALTQGRAGEEEAFAPGAQRGAPPPQLLRVQMSTAPHAAPPTWYCTGVWTPW